MTRDTRIRTEREAVIAGGILPAIVQRDTETAQPSRWTEIVKRRGLIVGVAALIAGALSRRAAPAEAVTGGGTDGFFVNGSNFSNTPNSATSLSVLTTASGYSSPLLMDFECVNGNGTNSNAVFANALGTGYGVLGQCGAAEGLNALTLQSVGVWGNSLNSTDGVLGNTNGTTTPAGVHGVSTGLAGNGVIGEANSGFGAFGVWGKSSSGIGVNGQGGRIGVQGSVTGAGTAGVSGISSGTFPGVLGLADGTSAPTGITAGVIGNAAAHTGVLGLSTSSTGAAGVEGDGNLLGVQGVASAAGATGYGVKGIANVSGASGGSAGVLGYAPNGVGNGFYGFTTDPNGAGCLAYNTTTGAGLIAYNGGGSGSNIYAAIFGSGATAHSGNVLVRGTLTQLGGAPTTGARDASGALHRLYGVQSPES